MTTPTQQLLAACERLKGLDAKATPGPWDYRQDVLDLRHPRNPDEELTIQSRNLAPILARLMPVMVEALSRWLIKDAEGFYPDELTNYTPTLSSTAKQALSKIEEEFPPEEKK
jgi:hypothetical protein